MLTLNTRGHSDDCFCMENYHRRNQHAHHHCNTLPQIQMHRQDQALQRGAKPGHVSCLITEAEKRLVHNQIKEALVQATLIKASNKFNNVYPKLCALSSKLERELDSKILRREPITSPANARAHASSPSGVCACLLLTLAKASLTWCRVIAVNLSKSPR